MGKEIKYLSTNHKEGSQQEHEYSADLKFVFLQFLIGKYQLIIFVEKTLLHYFPPPPPAPPPAARCGQVGSEETEGTGGARCDCEQETLLSGQLAGGCGSSVRDGRLLADWAATSSPPALQINTRATP